MKKDEFIEYWAFMFMSWCTFLSSEVAYFIACQCALETGYGTSDFYKDLHNLFGMRYPKSRISLAEGSLYGHCKFHYYDSSFYDYLIWLQMRGFNHYDLLDLTRFSAKLRTSGFNPSGKYVDTIMSIYKMFCK